MYSFAFCSFIDEYKDPSDYKTPWIELPDALVSWLSSLTSTVHMQLEYAPLKPKG